MDLGRLIRHNDDFSDVVFGKQRCLVSRTPSKSEYGNTLSDPAMKALCEDSTISLRIFFGSMEFFSGTMEILHCWLIGRLGLCLYFYSLYYICVIYLVSFNEYNDFFVDETACTVA